MRVRETYKSMKIELSHEMIETYHKISGKSDDHWDQSTLMMKSNMTHLYSQYITSHKHKLLLILRIKLYLVFIGAVWTNGDLHSTYQT